MNAFAIEAQQALPELELALLFVFDFCRHCVFNDILKDRHSPRNTEINDSHGVLFWQPPYIHLYHFLKRTIITLTKPR